jgi:hypothetical protein
MQRFMRQGRLVALLTMVLTLGTVGIARAEPSSACRALAKQFAETPEKVSAEQLFRLQACIHRELGYRGVDESSPAPSPMPKFPSVPGLTPAPALP